MIFSSVIYYEQVVARVKSLAMDHLILNILTMRVLVAFCVISIHASANIVPNRIAIIGGIEAKPNALPWNVINFHKGETRCSSTIINNMSQICYYCCPLCANEA